jgi:tetratricopeptide (TPR) repeat protein
MNTPWKLTSVRRRTLFVLLVLTAASAQLAGLYMIPETERVPVERLVANLERALEADPRNIQTRINLARLHGMAFALKTEQVDAARWGRNAPQEPYYGFNRDRIPYKAIKAPTPEAEAAARKHLDKAIAHYEAALALDPRKLLAQLGYGWMQQQAGDRSRAIAQYRKLIRQAWFAEERTPRNLPEDRYFTHEAAGYLISLLDPVADAAEIEDLRTKRSYLEGRPARAITPLAIPLEDDVPPGAIRDLQTTVRFDADGSGLIRSWTWISPAAGWLVHDPERSGRITSALQWFGNVTFWLFWENGYQALGPLDDDGDGELAGNELRDLAIWHDRDSNGISDSDEVRPLSSHHIVGLSCRHVAADSPGFAAWSPRGVRLSDGRTRPSYDVMLHTVDPRLLSHR